MSTSTPPCAQASPEDPADIVPAEMMNLTMQRCYYRNDVQVALDFFSKILPGVRLSGEAGKDTLELMESVLMNSPTFKRKREGGDIPDAIADRLAKMHMLAKRTYLRHFRIEDPHGIITEIFGPDFKATNLKMYDMARGRLLGSIYQIKHNSIDAGIKHVRSLIDEAGSLVITNHHVPTLRAFFEAKFSIENVLVIFYWVEPIIDLEKSRNRVKSMMRSIYINLCTQIKMHIDKPYSARYNKAQLGEFWDKLGISKRWDGIDLKHYHVRPPKIRRKKAKLGNLPITDLDDDVRFGDPENEIYAISDVSDGEEGADEAPGAPISSARRGASPASSDISEHIVDDDVDDDEEVIQSGADALLEILA
ncbi:hypothetical protein DFP73DRAFT_597296 [Morchella snyderi]|nr:hypothetical protein DFP73DRAFT_597296 [Morchella snyderi]